MGMSFLLRWESLLVPKEAFLKEKCNISMSICATNKQCSQSANCIRHPPYFLRIFLLKHSLFKKKLYVCTFERVAGKDTMWYQTGEQKTLRPQRSPMPQPIMVY